MKGIEKLADLIPSPRMAIAGLAVALAAFLVAQFNYLLFHSTAEGFAILVAVLIFVVGTRTYKYSGDNFLLFLGNAYLFVAVLDFLHTLTYEGMGVFPGIGPDVPTQLWVAGRFVAALSFFLATFFIGRIGRSFSRRAMFWGYALATSALAASILVFRVFPTCYLPGQGLTPFKIGSEYAVVLIVLAAMWRLRSQRDHINHSLYLLMMAAMAVTILSEVSFTLYTDVYGVVNLVGHLFKILAYYLVYLGIVRQGLERPYLEVTRLNEELEGRVQARTAQLEASNLDLEREIAEHRKTEMALRESEERFRLAFQQAAVGVAHVALDGAFLRVNQKLCDIVGYRREELIRKSFQEITYSEDLDADLSLTAQLLAGEIDTYSLEERYVRSDGSLVWVNMFGSLVRDGSGQPNYFVAVVEDISRRKEAEADRERLQEQQQDYIRAVSHDLRNPLTAVLGQAQMLRRLMAKAGMVDGLEQRSTDAIIASARRMDAMIQELSEAARLESGHLELNLVPIDLPSFALDLKERMAEPGDADRVQVVAPEDLPMAWADANRLERILRNLLSNALKYSPPESCVTVSLNHQNGQVVTAVIDQGQGMEPEEVDSLFQRYYRTRAAREQKGGLGLGLYITKGLVEAHGGRIWVESEPGRGSTFRFTLLTA